MGSPNTAVWAARGPDRYSQMTPTSRVSMFQPSECHKESRRGGRPLVAPCVCSGSMRFPRVQGGLASAYIASNVSDDVPL